MVPYKECKCGAPVWDGRLPHYLERIVCTSCGTDNSRKPPLQWRLNYGWYLLRKRLRLLGIRETWRKGIRDAFTLPREREANVPVQPSESLPVSYDSL